MIYCIYLSNYNSLGKTIDKINNIITLINLLKFITGDAVLHRSVVHAQYHANTSCVPLRLTHSLSSRGSVTYLFFYFNFIVRHIKIEGKRFH